MTSHEKALAEWKENNPRRKGTDTHYANGKPKVAGKTQKQIKADRVKPVASHYKTSINEAHKKPPKYSAKHLYGWAGQVAENRVRNQKSSPNKHYEDKKYREDYF